MSQVSQVSQKVASTYVKTICGVCNQKGARVLACGHTFHLKCLVNRQCNECGVLAKKTKKTQSNDLVITYTKTSCSACNKGRARVLACGHTFHLKCLVNSQCKECGFDIKGDIKKCDNFTQSITTNTNGNVLITVNQQDQWGRTTIIREIKKDKINDYMATIKDNIKNKKDNKIDGKTNLGLMFMSQLMATPQHCVNGNTTKAIR